jgi:LuxR family maltose regulon positive regulatory protein
VTELLQDASRPDSNSVWPEVCAHKLFAPPKYSGAIRRAHALGRILDPEAPRTTFLQAPAGHGKSTLLQQAKGAFESLGFRTGWLTFDDADNDMRRCSLHLHALLSSALGVDPEMAPIEIKPGSKGRQRRSDWFINHIVASDRPVALFFDEFQSLTSRPILEFFRELLERLPDNVRIFIGSRSTPDVGLVRLVVNNQALLLRADDLRFSPLEVAQFFSTACDLAISPDEVEAIYRQTEGWPAALQLFRLTLGSPTVRQSLTDLGSFRPRELAEYLADNVLSLQPAAIQEFLLRTSLLRRLTAPLCDAITERKDSQDVLLFLERSGLFVRMLDSGGHWFTYHTLFSSCLAERFGEISRDAVEHVHRGAAAWFRAHELYEESLHHAVEAGDFGFAADVLDVWASKLVPNGHLITVERWFDRLPLQEIQSRPDLVKKIAWSLIFLRRHQKVGPVLATLDAVKADTHARVPGDLNVVRSMAAMMYDDVVSAFQFIDQVQVRGQRPEGFWAFELGAAANMTAYRALVIGDLDEARACLALAHSYNDTVDASFSGGYTVGLSGIHLMIQGLLPQALERFRAATSEHTPGLDKSFSSAALTSCHIYALYQANQFDAAEALFAQFQDSIADSALLDFLAVAYLSMVRIHESKARAVRALELLDEAEAIGHANRWPRLIRLVTWERVRGALLRGELARAQSLAAKLGESADDLPGGWLPFSADVAGDALGNIRLAIHTGDTQAAHARLTRELSLAVTHGRVHRQIKLHILNALLQTRSGDSNLGCRSLRKALRLAQSGGFVHVFLEEGEEVLTMLRAEQHALDGANGAPFDISLPFVNRILQAAGIHAAEGAARDRIDVPEPLTDREIQILVQLTNGVSNRQMAGKIFVSENTVKYHLKNIYTKLKVSGRVQAINAARDLGLIR